MHKVYDRWPELARTAFESDVESIKSFGCICIVQHHTKTEFDLRNIYKNSQVPFIYDCQSRLDYDPNSKTILKKLGG